MPLKGIISPSGKELSWEQYLVSNERGLFPRPARYNMFRELAPARSRWISPSSLCYCLRKAKWEFEREYYLTEQSAYPLFRGCIVHTMFATPKETNEGALVEEDIKCKIPGTDFVIGGRLDRWEKEILSDYKSLADNGMHILASTGIKQEHIWQTNIYKLILKRGYNLDTKEIKIIYVTMKGIVQSGSTFHISDRRGGEKEIKLASCPIYADDKILDFMVPKIKLITEGYAPPAAPQDWLCKSCYFKRECEATIGKGTSQVEDMAMPKTPEIPKSVDVNDLF